MTQSDGAAIHIELIQIKTEIMAYGHRLSGKSLVRLDQVEVADFHAGFLHYFSGGGNRSDAHDGGIHACQLSGNPGRHRGNAQFLRLFFAHDDDGGRAVVDAGSVSCGYKSAVLLKGGTKLGKALHRYALSGAFIRIHSDGSFFGLYFYRNDFLFETALIHGLFAFLLAVGSELVQLFAGQSPLLADIFCGHSHVVAVKCVGKRIL